MPRAGHENLGQLLLRAFRWFDQGLIAHMHAAGWPAIRRSHSLVFAHLDRGGTRISELARRIGISRQAAQETVSELVGMGLVELVPDPSNRSARLVMVTHAGANSVKAARRAYVGMERELERRIGARSYAALRKALGRDWGPPPAT